MCCRKKSAKNNFVCVSRVLKEVLGFIKAEIKYYVDEARKGIKIKLFC